MRAVGLVGKDEAGRYRLTGSGSLVLALVEGIDFAAGRWDFITGHDISRIPEPFLTRLGDLADSRALSDLYGNLEAGREVLGEAAERFYIMAPELPPETFPPVEEVRDKARRGLDVRVVVDQRFRPPRWIGATQRPFFRVVSTVPGVVCTSEKSACLALRGHGGSIDPTAGLFSRSERFVRWCTDLVDWFWSRGGPLR